LFFLCFSVCLIFKPHSKPLIEFQLLLEGNMACGAIFANWLDTVWVKDMAACLHLHELCSGFWSVAARKKVIGHFHVVLFYDFTGGFLLGFCGFALFFGVCFHAFLAFWKIGRSSDGENAVLVNDDLLDGLPNGTNDSHIHFLESGGSCDWVWFLRNFIA